LWERLFRIQDARLSFRQKRLLYWRKKWPHALTASSSESGMKSSSELSATKTSPEGNTETFFPGCVDSSPSTNLPTRLVLFKTGTSTEDGGAENVIQN